MRCEQSTENSRLLIVSGLPDSASTYESLEIIVTYTGPGNGCKGVTLDGHIIPAIVKALNEPTIPEQPGVVFEIMSLDGCVKDEIVEFFQVPYWTNSCSFDASERHYMMVKGLRVDPAEQFVVLWANRDRPTIKEMVDRYAELFKEDEEY